RLPPDAALDVVDLGTGSGAVALAIAAERPHYRVTATDVSHDALAIMRRNAERHGITNVEAIAGRWFEPLAGRRFHLIVSNPPYIADDDPHLRQGDLRFEPRDALASGPDGLDAIREIATGAGNHLHPGGWLLVEHGWEQATAVRELFEAAGLTAVASLRDLSGHERVTLGRQSGPADPATS
ncbi:MAG: peptide chain release factor N(5)-glutamine methyltransferase, partial [Ectothiorhodospiraceae bacterium]|nr:peptide chain release factor N(5)-glutamine methyltransferase [Ectothiorhodospiraceae bacterium]